MDGAIQAFLTRRKSLPPLGRWEADIEANNLFNLAIRHIESIVELARRDLVLLPSANVLARAVFETSVKAAWMVQPDDPFQRELRWLAHLQEEVRMHDRLVSRGLRFGSVDLHPIKERGDQIREFQKHVVSKLPTGYSELKGNPSVEEMLESVGQAQVYPCYIQLAAYVHGTHSATWLYRRNLGNQKELGDYIEPEKWFLPLWTSWKCIQVLGQFFFDRLDSEPAPFIDSEKCETIDKSLFDLLVAPPQPAPS